MTYTHGHHESVLRSHTWRTAENSAGYLLPHLRPGLSLLDIGCGPGTITVDLARLVAPGQVVGLDASAEVVAQAEGTAPCRSGLANLRFEVGDLFALNYDDASFDVVHAHQVLQHLTDPVAALVEMRRVLRPMAMLAVRDGDFGAFTLGPGRPACSTAGWSSTSAITGRNRPRRADRPVACSGLAHEAGFTEVTVAELHCWTFADPEARAWWGGLWADRVRYSRFAEQAVAYELSDADELEVHRPGLQLRWAAAPDGVFIVVNVEILARR